ncbi:NfeD family protein [Leptothoe sp. PORK10 BA2]|uniref:NfeD family protein n=1 Tax=Leptothoe sp. PORK10 BA2 TaxID=3110254 RepID=UPI003FA374B7
MNGMFNFLPRSKNQNKSTNTYNTLPVNVTNLQYEAVVDDVIHSGREWRVRYKSILWRARAAQSGCYFHPGDVVYVVGREGLVLLIQTVPTIEI